MAVVVLGDLGRSPRMQYHALALAVNDGAVDLVGLEGAPLSDAVTAEPRIHSHRLSDSAFASRRAGGRRRFVWLSSLRAARQALGLFIRLMRLPTPAVVLVQSPPAVPTLAVAWLVARLRRARFVIDWHNLSHAILAVSLGDRHRAVRALARSERRWARRADGHLTVSHAMAEWLRREWGVQAQVVYDRPPAFFTRSTPELDHQSWARLARTLDLGDRRRPLVVCPTSWTPDEDFDLLLDALERTERALAHDPARVAGGLTVLMTGRGQLRDHFQHRLSRRQFQRVIVRTAWIEPGDYPSVIALADAGLCLHQSASGLDLPMKLADFRGAGVPVAAFDYAPVLSEVLTNGHEGVTFRDPGDLAALLVALASGRLDEVPKFAAARAWLAANPARRWNEEWTEHAAPRLGVIRTSAQ